MPASVQEVVDQVTGTGVDRLIFDLGGLEFIDSSGLAVLLAAAQKVPSVQLRNPSPIVRRVVEVTGLSEIVADGTMRDPPLDAATAATERDCRLFAGVLASVASARRFVVEALGQAPKPLLDAVELMVSELASNCVQHTAAEFEVCIVRASPHGAGRSDGFRPRRT